MDGTQSCRKRTGNNMDETWKTQVTADNTEDSEFSQGCDTSHTHRVEGCLQRKDNCEEEQEKNTHDILTRDRGESWEGSVTTLGPRFLSRDTVYRHFTFSFMASV